MQISPCDAEAIDMLAADKGFCRVDACYTVMTETFAADKCFHRIFDTGDYTY